MKVREQLKKEKEEELKEKEDQDKLDMQLQQEEKKKTAYHFSQSDRIFRYRRSWLDRIHVPLKFLCSPGWPF